MIPPGPNGKGKLLTLGQKCIHVGMIVPMAMIKAIVDAKMPDGEIKKVEVFLTKSAQCIMCGNAWEFDHTPQAPTKADGEAPAPAAAIQAPPATQPEAAADPEAVDSPASAEAAPTDPPPESPAE
jgi:hypothetical protein